VVSIDDTEQTRAVNELHDLLHHDSEPKKSTISFSYSHDKPTNLGEATHKEPNAQKGPAAGLIQMGELLNGFKSLRRTTTGEAVSSLTSALHAKQLMDTLKPDSEGSFAHEKKESSLGEAQDKDISGPTFSELMNAKEKNMGAITQYLMARKAEGIPLTADEDQQLQKFYYNRASTILKRIVLLKQGEAPPAFTDPEKSQSKVDPSGDDQPAGDDMPDEDTLKYDAKVAKANTAYNHRQAHKLEAQEEEIDAERKAEDSAEMESLAFDQKVAEANEHYNDKLLADVQKQAQNAAHVSLVAKKAAEALQAGLRKEDAMSKVERELQNQRADAQQAVQRFTLEQEDAEKKVLAAEKDKKEADLEAAKASQMLKDAEAEAAVEKHAPEGHKATHKKPRMLPPAERMSNMVKYLRTALSHHNVISKEDLQIMQSFFLQHGGQLLSKLAQIEPDATWTDKGVVGTEQWAMDHHQPDKLSQEWGGKKLKAETLVRDVMKNQILHRHSPHELQRPGTQQAVEGLFGTSAKLPLAFAPDSSAKIHSEPMLGEAMDDAQEVRPRKFAYSSMLGVQ
jgi:hypothetical protein